MEKLGKENAESSIKHARLSCGVQFEGWPSLCYQKIQNSMSIQTGTLFSVMVKSILVKAMMSSATKAGPRLSLHGQKGKHYLTCGKKQVSLG